jgi:hypothetical protein
MMVTFRKLEHTIVGTVDGRPFNVPRTDATEAWLIKAIADKMDGKDILKYLKSTRNQEIAGSNKYLAFNPLTQKYYLELDGHRSKHPIPKTLVKFIEDSYEKKVDFMPVVKAWARLLANPRYTPEMAKYFSTYLETTYVDLEEVEQIMDEQDLNREIATQMATYQDIAITQEGLLATYKVANIVTWQYEMVMNDETGNYEKVRNNKYKPIADKIDPTTGDIIEVGGFEKPANLEDFQFTPCICLSGDKFFSGDKIGYVYEVGKMQYLPKDAKRNLQNTFGGGGLYSGGLKYVEGYRNSGSHVLTCFVNPSDIISFQSEGHAFRTDAIMPNNVWDETIPLKGTYHSSDYGKVSDERVAAIVAEAIAAGEDKKHKADE